MTGRELWEAYWIIQNNLNNCGTDETWESIDATEKAVWVLLAEEANK